jgi:hypothetical protein
VAPSELEDNLGINTGIVPMFRSDMLLMRDRVDNNGIWANTVEIMRAEVLDKDLKILDLAFRYNNASPNLSQFLQKLE